MSDIRILEIISPSRIGGAEVYVTDLCERLSRMGAEVELFCPSGRPFIGYALGRGITSISWKTRGKLDPLTVIKLARLIKKHHFDVVHTHLSTASLLGAFAARLAGVPSVAHVHGMNTATCFRYSTLVIAVSHAVKKHLCAQGMDENKIRVIHNGVDLTHFTPVPLAEARSKQQYSQVPTFGVFGRLSSEKGQRVALEAMFILLKDHPGARLIFAGEGYERPDLEEAALALGIRDNVEFRGFIRDIRPLMSACDAVLVPSIKEGFGLAAVEAMALERPVIATMVGGLPEIVVDGETGFLVPPNDPAALAEQMGEIIADSARAAEIGAQGRARVEQCFDAEKQTAEVLALLREVAST